MPGWVSLDSSLKAEKWTGDFMADPVRGKVQFNGAIELIKSNHPILGRSNAA
jgi:hypothetical protein